MGFLPAQKKTFQVLIAILLAKKGTRLLGQVKLNA